jgi:coproporphyrinogen III oxidase
MADPLSSARAERMHAFFLEAQDRIVAGLEALEPRGRFGEDRWDRPEGGGGRSRVLEEGETFEKGGVNVSCVHGELSEAFASQLPGSGRRFVATGVSLVIHPRNPHAPTAHANFRYLEKGDDDERVAWFGGGADLTPWILYDEDAVDFHRVWRDVCARHEVADHGRFKTWCDEYFHIPHRGEARGVGGIFFDYLGLDGPPGTPADLDAVEAFVRDGADAFVPAYAPIVDRRRSTPATDAERDWQLLRRGRYVEFNLVYDRGTVFGLKTGGRIESILMSLPNLVRWGYDRQPETDAEKRLVDVLRSPRDWLAGA